MLPRQENMKKGVQYTHSLYSKFRGRTDNIL